MLEADSEVASLRQPLFKDGWYRSIAMSLVLFIATRAIFLLIGVDSFRFDGQPVPWSQLWVQWDANIYMDITARGYHPPEITTGFETGQSNINFFPLMPLLAAGVHLLVHSIRLSGLLAANLCLLIATIFLHRLTLRRFDRDAADWAVASLMVVPGSFALSSPMSEAPFLALSILSAYLMPICGEAASLSSAFLTITRWTGILQGLGLALDWLLARIKHHKTATYRNLLPICFIPIPLLFFLVFIYNLTGDFLAPLHSNYAFWHQQFGYPFQSLVLFLSTMQPRLEMQSVITLLLVGITLAQLRYFSAGETFFVLTSLASFSSSEAASPSLIRYTIGLYPVHLAIGRLSAKSPAMRVLLILLAMIGAALSIFWFHGRDDYV